MKSRGIAALGTVSLALTLAACGSDSAADGTRLEFQTGLAVDSDILAALTQVTEEFEKQNPDVSIELAPRTDTYEADLKVRLAANNPPDLWATHGWSLGRYAEFLLPLQDEPWAANVNPALDAAMRNDAGEIFAYPVDTDIAGIVYNRTALADAGIDPAAISTWEDFDDAAARAKAAGLVPITASGKDDWFAGNLADWMLSGAYTPEQGQEQIDGTFVPDAYGLVLDEVDSWREAGYFNPDYSSATTDDIARALGEGTTGFVFIQNSLVANALQFAPDARLGFMPVPSFVEDTGYFIGGEGQAYGISKDTEHADAAKAYIAFLAQPENTSAIAAAAGTLPGLTDADPQLGHLADSYEEFVEPGAFPLVPYFDRIYLPNGMWNTVVSTTDAVITGQSAPAAALTQIEGDFTTMGGKGE